MQMENHTDDYSMLPACHKTRRAIATDPSSLLAPRWRGGWHARHDWGVVLSSMEQPALSPYPSVRLIRSHPRVPHQGAKTPQNRMVWHSREPHHAM